MELALEKETLQDFTTHQLCGPALKYNSHARKSQLCELHKHTCRMLELTL